MGCSLGGVVQAMGCYHISSVVEEDNRIHAELFIRDFPGEVHEAMAIPQDDKLIVDMIVDRCG